MVQEVFDSFLSELGEILEIEDLGLDENGTCLLQFPNELEVYIEPFEEADFMLISTDIAQVPTGRYRENVFREALKANGLPFPRHGTFGYSPDSEQLILFDFLALKELTGERIASFLTPFTEKAEKWKTTIDSNEVPLADVTATGPSQAPKGIFGLRP